MSDPNYNEIVILPFLEKKCKDLLSVNLVLEAKLLAEIEKSKWLQNKVDSLQTRLDKDRRSKKKPDVAESLDGETY